MVENIIHEMIALADEKLEGLNVILDIKPKQKEVIQQENMEGIESTINNIQSQIKKIDKVDSIYMLKLNELKANTGIESISQLDDTKYPNAIILKNRLEEIKIVLKNIKVIDDENQLLIGEKFEETKGRLKSLRQGQKMAKGYSVDYDETIFIDERN